MNADFDVIIIGSGPAGVSASFPLVEAGLRVLLVDGGRKIDILPPSKPYLSHRVEDKKQWLWMVGEDYHALKNIHAVSPKLRVPSHSYVFEGFNTINQINSDNFITVGSLSSGGLSNAWGCGVSKFSASDLVNFPFKPQDIEASYEIVTRRIGVSGARADDLSEYFGLDSWADQPISIDPLQQQLLDKYQHYRKAILQAGMRMGRSRVAVLSQDRNSRLACNLCGNCLWGCHRHSLYSAADDIETLKQHANFQYQSGFLVHNIKRRGNILIVEGDDRLSSQQLTSKIIILAAGTLASTRLALKVMNFTRSVPMQACPTGAFMLWLPKALGSHLLSAFGFGQLSFALSLDGEKTAFGSLFNITGIPVAEFVRHMPTRKRYAIDIIANLFSSCIVGNLFMPGNLSSVTLSLKDNSYLKVEGGYRSNVSELMNDAEYRLRKIFFKLGALLLPKSFKVGKPGSDIHYGCSLPMKANPVMGETNSFGELYGVDGVYVVDGASLTMLPEKSHALTIMANADRIARKIVANLSSK